MTLAELKAKIERQEITQEEVIRLLTARDGLFEILVHADNFSEIIEVGHLFIRYVQERPELAGQERISRAIAQLETEVQKTEKILEEPRFLEFCKYICEEFYVQVGAINLALQNCFTLRPFLLKDQEYGRLYDEIQNMFQRIVQARIEDLKLGDINALHDLVEKWVERVVFICKDKVKGKDITFSIDLSEKIKLPTIYNVGEFRNYGAVKAGFQQKYHRTQHPLLQALHGMVKKIGEFTSQVNQVKKQNQ